MPVPRSAYFVTPITRIKFDYDFGMIYFRGTNGTSKKPRWTSLNECSITCSVIKYFKTAAAAAAAVATGPVQKAENK